MRVTVEASTATQLRLAVEIEAHAFAEAGSPPGNVPPVLAQQLATQLHEAARAHGVRTFGEPWVEVTDRLDGRPVRCTVVADVRPEVTLPDLPGIMVTARPAELGEHEIDEYLAGLRRASAEFMPVDRPARVGDIVVIDLVARMDGAAVDGGEATGVTHEVGSGHPLGGLDRGLVGMAAGDTATMPSRLIGGLNAGVAVDLRVRVQTVSAVRLPDLDDAFAMRAGGVATLGALRGAVAGGLRRARHAERAVAIWEQALDELAATVSAPVPELAASRTRQRLSATLHAELRTFGIELADYLMAENLTPELLDVRLDEEAARQVRRQLMLDAVVDAHGIDVSRQELERATAMRGRPAGEGIAEDLRAGLRRAKALDLIRRRVSVREAAAE